MSTTLANNIVSRLQSAPRGSRELDAEVALAIGWREIPLFGWVNEQCPPQPNTLGGPPPDTRYRRDDVPHYTTSLDAAVRLLPIGERWNFKVGYSHATTGLPAYASCNGPRIHEAHTVALALCAAILGARLKEDAR